MAPAAAYFVGLGLTALPDFAGARNPVADWLYVAGAMAVVGGTFLAFWRPRWFGAEIAATGIVTAIVARDPDAAALRPLVELAVCLGLAATAYYTMAFARHDERMFDALPEQAGAKVARYVWSHVGLAVGVSAAALVCLLVLVAMLGSLVSDRWEASIEARSTAFWTVVAVLVLSMATISSLLRLALLPGRAKPDEATESGDA